MGLDGFEWTYDDSKCGTRKRDTHKCSNPRPNRSNRSGGHWIVGKHSTMLAVQPVNFRTNIVTRGVTYGFSSYRMTGKGGHVWRKPPILDTIEEAISSQVLSSSLGQS